MNGEHYHERIYAFEAWFRWGVHDLDHGNGAPAALFKVWHNLEQCVVATEAVPVTFGTAMPLMLNEKATDNYTAKNVWKNVDDDDQIIDAN